MVCLSLLFLGWMITDRKEAGGHRIACAFRHPKYGQNSVVLVHDTGILGLRAALNWHMLLYCPKAVHLIPVKEISQIKTKEISK